jgi:hypothetical protein
MSVSLSGRKVLGTNLNCSESCLDIRWWEIAALQNLVSADVRFGSDSDIRRCPLNVRFAPESGHCSAS